MPLECNFKFRGALAALLVALCHVEAVRSELPSYGESRIRSITYNIQTYRFSGNSLLTEPELNRLMAGAIGTNISLARIERALKEIPEAYRGRGYNAVSVLLPRQNLAEGIVEVQIAELSQVNGQTSLIGESPKKAATYNIQHFELRGNTALEPEAIDRILSSVAGENVGLALLQAGLVDLQKAYQEKGYAAASVTLPDQVLTGGKVMIDVVEGQQTSVLDFSARFPTNSAPPLPARTFEVRQYDVAGNTLLAPETLTNILSGGTGDAISLSQVQKAIGDLQLAYRERGYATVSVGLPQQQVTNATIKVRVTEGSVTDVRVTGNRYFSSNNIVRAVPSIRTNEILNSRILQRELDIANQNRDRQIYPTIEPGAEPGESALVLRVKDRLPLHGRIEANNLSTPGTPEWRVNSSLQYNNLWQREHQIGLSYGFSPEKFKREGTFNDYFLNRPLVAYGGLYYRMPFGGPESVAERVASSSSQFGYDEATRQFRLPAAGGQPDWSFFASASSSDTGVKFSPDTVVSRTPLLTIVSRDAGQNLSINASGGGRFNYPVAIDESRRLNFSAGPEFKLYQLKSYNTNNFIVTTVVTNLQGSQTIESIVASPQPVRQNEVTYLPISLGADFFETDAQGHLSANLGLSGNLVGRDQDFATLAYSREAEAAYVKGTGSLTRDQKLGAGWSLLLRTGGQMASGPLLNTEQFALGGLNSVRGYFEGDEYGDAGWSSTVELRTPFLESRVPVWKDFAPVWLRGSVFVDAGQRFLLSSAIHSSRSLLGTGFSLSANIDNTVDTRITVGWPLLDSGNTAAGDPRVYFSLGGQF